MPRRLTNEEELEHDYRKGCIQIPFGPEKGELISKALVRYLIDNADDLTLGGQEMASALGFIFEYRFTNWFEHWILRKGKSVFVAVSIPPWLREKLNEPV